MMDVGESNSHLGSRAGAVRRRRAELVFCSFVILSVVGIPFTLEWRVIWPVMLLLLGVLMGAQASCFAHGLNLRAAESFRMASEGLSANEFIESSRILQMLTNDLILISLSSLGPLGIAVMMVYSLNEIPVLMILAIIGWIVGALGGIVLMRKLDAGVGP